MRFRHLWVGLIVGSMLLLTSVTYASASRPIRTVSDTISVVNTFSFEPVNDRVTKLSFTSDQQWRGDWNGRNVFVCNAIINADKLFSTGGCTGTFEGTVLGRSGTLTLSAVTIVFQDGTKEIDQGAILSGTGALKGLRGHLATLVDLGFEPTLTLVWFVHFE